LLTFSFTASNYVQRPLISSLIAWILVSVANLSVSVSIFSNCPHNLSTYLYLFSITGQNASISSYNTWILFVNAISASLAVFSSVISSNYANNSVILVLAKFKSAYISLVALLLAEISVLSVKVPASSWSLVISALASATWASIARYSTVPSATILLNCSFSSALFQAFSLSYICLTAWS